MDVLEDLKRVVTSKGVSRYEALIKLYVRKRLREELERLWEEEETGRLEAMSEEFEFKETQKP
jgi:hypothetical protein